MTPDRFLGLAQVVALLDSPNIAVQVRALESLRRQGVVWTELTRELGCTLRGTPRPPAPVAKPQPAPVAKRKKLPPLAERLRVRAEREERLKARAMMAATKATSRTDTPS